MEISKLQILGLLFFLVNCPNILAKPATPGPIDLNELNTSILELQALSFYTRKTMDWVRNDKGYPGRSYVKPCNLPTYLLYKSSAYRFYNATTMHQHLKKIKNTLRPLFDATVPRIDFFNDVTKNVENKTLREALTNLATYIADPLRILNTMGYRGSGNIIYKSSKLTQHVKLYMNRSCASIPITKKATQFLRYATFIEAVEIAVNDLAGDLSFINKYLPTII